MTTSDGKRYLKLDKKYLLTYFVENGIRGVLVLRPMESTNPRTFCPAQVMPSMSPWTVTQILYLGRAKGLFISPRISNGWSRTYSEARFGLQSFFIHGCKTRSRQGRCQGSRATLHDSRGGSRQDPFHGRYQTRSEEGLGHALD